MSIIASISNLVSQKDIVAVFRCVAKLSLLHFTQIGETVQLPKGPLTCAIVYNSHAMKVNAEQRLQAEPGRGMVPRAKGNPRLQCYVHSRCILGLAPGGYDPETLIDLSRLIAVPNALKPLLILYVLYLQEDHTISVATHTMICT